MNIGERIQATRKSAGLTQGQLAEKMHVTQSLVSQYERGMKTPGIGLLHRFADAIGCDIVDLLIDRAAGEKDLPDLIPIIAQSKDDGENYNDIKDAAERIGRYNIEQRVNAAIERQKVINADPRFATNEADRAYRLLNDEGKAKLIAYAGDLLRITEYKIPENKIPQYRSRIEDE